MRFFREMNSFVRGLLIVGAIALVVVILQLQATLTALFLIAQIAFFLAIAFFIYLVWRERRSRHRHVAEPGEGRRSTARRF